MTRFDLYSPEQSDTLAAVREHVGFVPNIFAVLGANEQVMTAFANANTAFAEGGLSPLEREIVQTAVSVVNGCGYCVAGHTAFASMAELDPSPIRAIRDGVPIDDDKLQALRRFAESLAATHGKASQPELDAFEAAGYTRAQVFDVLLGMAIKSFTNAASSLTGIALDEPFQPFAWNAERAEAAVVTT